MDDQQKLREDAWAALKKMHDQANGLIFDEFTKITAGGWCAPRSVIYSNDWRPGIYAGTYVRDVTP